MTAVQAPIIFPPHGLSYHPKVVGSDFFGFTQVARAGKHDEARRHLCSELQANLRDYCKTSGLRASAFRWLDPVQASGWTAIVGTTCDRLPDRGLVARVICYAVFSSQLSKVYRSN